MKVFYMFVLLAFLTFGTILQAQDKISYQAVVRNNAGQLLTNTSIGVQVSLVKGSAQGSISYQETHAVATNPNGLLTFEIGDGNAASGNYADIDWENGPYFAKIELDMAGGTNYSLFSTSQLNSVPYALHARKADALTTPAKELDPAFTSSAAADIKKEDIAGWNAKSGIAAGDGIAIRDNTASISAGTRINDLKVWNGTSWINKAINVQSNSAGGSQPVNIRNPYLGLNYQMALMGIFPSRNGMDPFVGEIMLFAGDFTVKGYTMCNGTILSIAQNTALFAVIGPRYGGNGTTTFAVPDLRGRSAVHMGTGSGLSPVAIGQMGGAENVTLTPAQMPAHNHSNTITFSEPD